MKKLMETINKFADYMKRLGENKKVVVEEEDVKDITEDIEAYFSNNGHTYSYSENMAGQVLIIVH
ncbi:hypothetical protein ACQVQY_25505 [Bacillus mycoides]|uniref:hypothetical protein n=1 Tax=Bacillus mycoides TaxID=1405 RepID=UPI003D65CF4C